MEHNTALNVSSFYISCFLNFTFFFLISTFFFCCFLFLVFFVIIFKRSSTGEKREKRLNDLKVLPFLMLKFFFCSLRLAAFLYIYIYIFYSVQFFSQFSSFFSCVVVGKMKIIAKTTRNRKKERKKNTQRMFLAPSSSSSSIPSLWKIFLFFFCCWLSLHRCRRTISRPEIYQQQNGNTTTNKHSYNEQKKMV